MVLITEKSLRQLYLKQKLPKEYPLKDGDRLTPSARDFLLEHKIRITHIPKGLEEKNHSSILIPVGVSNRHVHLSVEHFQVLFGDTADLTEERHLSQPGQFAAREAVTIVGSKGVLQNVRILGPFREQTQVEVSRTDGFKLGIHPPIRLSGSIDGTPGITIVGPKGCVTIDKGLIVAKNHVHMSLKEAKELDVQNGDSIILLSEERSIIFYDVIARVKESYVLDFHLDQDEANAAQLTTRDKVRMIGKNHRLFSTFVGVERHG
ncbi:phosphate propanoyltransferase [Bacillus massilinigeriensis]|uniref:phosphate propanoyltransferase n=1 Tax=Bacillus massilionigeriensis TaxID=1805475 RepID=UPI00096B3C17|nr:phosphate propanoyltransferase [Bacillus massilionigeriensis]